MPLLLIIGGVLVLVGLALLAAWFGAFLTLLKAVVPLSVIALGGLLAYFGWEERKDRRGAVMDFSSPAEANRYQADALAYQEKIDRIGEPGGQAESELIAAEPENERLEPASQTELLAAETSAPHVVIEKAPEDQREATVTVSDPPDGEER